MCVSKTGLVGYVCNVIQKDGGEKSINNVIFINNLYVVKLSVSHK